MGLRIELKSRLEGVSESTLSIMQLDDTLISDAEYHRKYMRFY